MNAYDLPTSLVIGEVDYAIRYGWRAILDILILQNDPELDEWAKVQGLLEIFYPDFWAMPYEHHEEALRKACEFIDCGQKDDGKPKPKMIDWEQDAPIIIPEINKVARQEVRLDPSLHWWTFFGWFMGIGEGLLASVLSIRQKKVKGKKLERWEQDYYRENRSLIDIKAPETEEMRAERENILRYL